MKAKKRRVAKAAGIALLLAGLGMSLPVRTFASTAQSAAAVDQAYRRFLPELQAALRSKDRRPLINLVSLPLRVNFAGHPRLYRNRQSVERDFSRIFTAKVRLAVLKQKRGSLFVRDQGAMVGDGELWFSETCRDSRCSDFGPVRIVAVNP
ncbi:MAG TPA: hypothetical protein VHS33_07985 [Sphingomicrobium sp.]|jgi:hypothetical protein|nr:hypothetical protein [Sphingomicrobium sp.]